MAVDRIGHHQKLQVSRDRLLNLQNKNVEPLTEELFKTLKKREF